MNIQEINLAYLKHTYYGPAVERTAKSLIRLQQRGESRELARLLRDHRKRGVYGQKTIERRARVDSLLSFFSILEISSIANFTSVDDLGELKGFFLSILQISELRIYFEEYYPLRLPQLFFRRLNGQNNLTEDMEDNNHLRLIAFFELDKRFRENIENGYLLMMLDFFEVEGY